MKELRPRRKETVRNYADAVGAERFRITVTEIGGSGTSAFVYDRKNGGYEGKTRDELLEAMPKLSTFAHYGKNIIVTPLSSDKHHILVDDLTPENLLRLKSDGYSPACVIESSPGNYQAIITVPSMEGDSAKDRAAANKLTRLLNQEYGNPKLSGSVHGHRLPPFPNCKPKHRREDGSYPITTLVETRGGFCEKARCELESTHAKMREAKKRLATTRGDAAASIGANNSDITASITNSLNNPNGAYWCHYRDIVSKLQGGGIDGSRVDAMIGIRMRVTGHSQDEIRSAIESNGPAMRREVMSAEAYESKYRYRDWSRYAAETTGNYVFGARGAVQYEKALPYQPLYLRLEGRTMSQQQETRRLAVATSTHPAAALRAPQKHLHR